MPEPFLWCAFERHVSLKTYAVNEEIAVNYAPTISFILQSFIRAVLYAHNTHRITHMPIFKQRTAPIYALNIKIEQQ